MIAFCVSQFLTIKENAEKYRKTFVEHEGKKDLIVNGAALGISPKSPKSNKEG